jgi:hypothetical protein
LAKALINEGFSVKGSTTSTEKIVVLENAEMWLEAAHENAAQTHRQLSCQW